MNRVVRVSRKAGLQTRRSSEVGHTEPNGKGDPFENESFLPKDLSQSRRVYGLCKVHRKEDLSPGSRLASNGTEASLWIDYASSV